MTETVDRRDATIESLREHQRAVSRVIQVVASGGGLQPVMDEIVWAAKTLCHGDSAQLYLAEGDLFVIAAQTLGPDAAYKYAEENPHARDRATVIGRVGLSGEVEQVPDVLADAEYAYEGQRMVGYRALLGVPIALDGSLIGAIAVARQHPGRFADDDIELVKTFADQAAIAISNARLIEAVERQLEQQQAISDVLGAVARSEGLESVLHALVEAAARLCDAEFGEVHLLEGDRLHLAVGHGGPPELYEYEREHPHVADRTTVSGRVALTRDVVHIPDILQDSEFDWDAANEAGVRALLGAPLLVEGNLVGVFNIVRTDPVPFTDEQIDLLRTFADQAAIAVANARLIGAVERQLDQQRAISDVLAAVARSEGLEAVFNVVVDSATRLCRGDYGALYLKEGELLQVVTQQYGEPDLYGFELEHPHTIDRSTVIGRAALTCEVAHIPDTRADAEYSWGGAGVAEYRALLAAPILVDGDLIGAMNVVRVEPEPFADEHIQLLKTFADQAAIAIANARLIEAVERQRTELSRFVSPQVAELLSSEDGEKMLAGHRAYISALFCDLRGFTAFAETAAPEELFEVLGEYHLALGDLIPKHEGTLEHFAGDGVMVFFNDPLPVEQHEVKAIRFALAAQERFAELDARWRKAGVELGLGIGIASGYATLGRIGFEGRYDYGALGPVTNLASRLSTHAEAGQILISQRVFADVEEVVEAEPIGEIELKGFGRPVAAYDVRGLR